MSTTDPSELFDAEYYDRSCGPLPLDRSVTYWQDHFATAARNLVDALRPGRVLDVGCAKGFLVEQLRDRGVEAYGLDISPYAISQVRDDVQPYCRVAAATDWIGERYDLITCVDVAQHLPEEDAVRLVRNLCEHADEVFFSAAGDHADPTHLNVKSSDYWQDLFCRNGYYPVLVGGPSYLGAEAIHFRKVTRKLRIAVFSREKEEWAVVRLRLLDPLRELERLGRVELTFVSSCAETLPIEELVDADIWVIHREFADRDLGGGLIEAARLLGKTVVFDIDDLVTNLPRSNRLWEYCSRVAPDLLEAMRDSDFVTASTPRLVEELAREEASLADKAYVLRNVLSTDVWGERYRAREHRPGEPLVVGWFGSATHDEDLALVKDAILYLARKHRGRVEFHFYGYLPDELKDVDGVCLMRGGVGDVKKHAQGVRAATIHAAIAPLTAHVFNQCKSDLRWLEYAICGIPGVYSNVTPYAASVRHGETGLLVENETAAWVAAIERLIDDHKLRSTIARNAFDEVRANYCVDVAAERWDELYRAFLATGPTTWADEDGDAAIRKAAGLLFRIQARAQARGGNVAGAVASLEAAMNLDDANVEAAIAAGIRLSQQNELAAAERLLGAAVAQSPGHADGFLGLAKLYRALGDDLRMEAVLNEAAIHHPADPDLARLHVEHLSGTGQEARVDARLAAMVDSSFQPEEAVTVAEMLVGMGRAKEALSVVERTGRAHPDVDFGPLKTALQTASRAGMVVAETVLAAAETLKIAVFTREPLSGARVQQRLAAPFRVLESAAMAEVRWSDGVIGADCLDWADLVVLHRGFAARDLAEPIVDRARAAGKPIVYETDDLPHELLAISGGAGAERLRDDVAWIVAEAALTTVPTPALRAVLTELAPAACERILTLETALDLGIWSSRSSWRERGNRPFSIGLVTDWARPVECGNLIEAFAPLVGGRRVSITTWSPFVAADAPLPGSPTVGSATPHYVEYARRLAQAPIDLALVPVSNDLYHTSLSDIIWAELAACRIPAMFSAREPFGSTVIQGHTGVLLGDDSKAWADTAARLIEADTLRRDLAGRAWTIALAERSLQPLAATWGQLYRAILERAEIPAEPARARAPVPVT